MELALPASGEARAETQEQADPTTVPDKDLDLKTEVTMTVLSKQGSKDGLLDSVTVEGNEGVSKTIALDPSSDPDLNALRTFLKGMQRNLTNKDSIKIRASSTLKYAFVVKVMDACSKAGFKNVGFAPPPPDLPGSN